MQQLSNKICICAIARDEGPYLAEWAIYHRMIGFDGIIVYNNESVDDSESVLSRLSEAGVLRYVNWPDQPNGRMQRLAYRDGFQRISEQYDWITFIDLDEFFVLPGVDDIHSFLRKYEAFDATAVNWKILGTSFHKQRQSGLVIERFTRCSKVDHSVNRAIKTIAKCSAIIEPMVHNHNFKDSVEYKTALGEIIPRAVGRSDMVSHDIIRLNHYFTKSREEWEEKVARGRVNWPAGHPEKFRKESDFRRNDRNEEEDSYLLKFADEIKSRIGDIFRK